MKRKILILNAHWNNRGDESAVRALIEGLNYPSNNISIQIVSPVVKQFPYKDDYAKLIPLYPRFRNIPEIILAILTKGRFIYSNEGKIFFKTVQESDYIIHAPGGPSIGDIYSFSEILYILRYLVVLRFGKKFIIAAPSVGPFNKKIRNIFRKKIFNSAEHIILREEISQNYLNTLLPQNKSIVTLDMAFCKKLNLEDYNKKLLKNEELNEFLKSNNVIGMTITDLAWHPIYSQQKSLSLKIKNEFNTLIDKLLNKGYKIIFIPQLFGLDNDMDYMKSFEKEGCITLSDQYDCFFQQYIIGRLHAVIGMRYHSNIFSAKMCTPFISISYEQKMQGFMNRIDLADYCISINDLESDLLHQKFEALETNYVNYRNYLKRINPELTELSKETLKIIWGDLNIES